MTIQITIPDYDEARRAMVDGQLRPQGVNDRVVLDAMAAVPRERFVPEHLRPIAYADRSVPLGAGRSLPPATVTGLLLAEMLPESGERALVVGAGTGYSAAVLQAIGLDVVALESCVELAAQTKELGIEVVEGPLDEGHKPGAPFDLILIDGAVEHIPEALIDQLADGGRLGAAIVGSGIARLIIGRKAAGGGFGHRSIADAAVATLPGFAKPEAFTF